MLISIWRYCHLAFALSSTLFVSILAATGIILAWDPIDEKLQPHPSAESFPELSIANTIEALSNTYAEVLSLEVDANGFVIASVIDENGTIEELYVHPQTGEKTGTLQAKTPLIEFATNLHRSLFLKSWGRFFVGLNSLLLFLIVVSGVALVIKRQQGIKHFFARIVNEHFTQYSHVYLGRILLLPLAVITLSGIYLSLLRFHLIPDPTPTHQIDFEAVSLTTEGTLAQIDLLQQTPLYQLRSVEFPFSEDPLDYYTLSLKDREVLIHQYTGEVLSELHYPLVVLSNQLSTNLHTGKGSILWSVVLGLSCLSIFYFMYSGFTMTLKRRSAKIQNRFSKKESSCIILVGSETGSTLLFARRLQEQLTQAGVRWYTAPMNAFEHYPNMKHLIVLTATYGQGDPPSNATRFKELLLKNRPVKPFTYSVVGFGSLGYPDFCKYAFSVEEWLHEIPAATSLMPVHTIHNRSLESFKQWVLAWGKSTHLHLVIQEEDTPKVRKGKQHSFEVLEVHDHRETYTLRLQPQQKTTKFQSGDLLAIRPTKGTYERLYSASILQSGQLFISIKRHAKGLCSNELSQLQQGDFLKGTLIQNNSFHFPKKQRPVVLICTGTGIAPFLGMLENNRQKTPVYLYWGGQSQEALSLYQQQINQSLKSQQLLAAHYAFSRDPSVPKTYVQELIERDARNIARVLANKGTLLLCGSVAMQQGVTTVLQHLCLEYNQTPLSVYQKKGRVRIDCY
jgi:sulfite reductase (NADPH) flavoprotein alpha-component